MLPVWTEVISEKETKGQREANSKHKHEINNKSSSSKKELFISAKLNSRWEEKFSRACTRGPGNS